MGTLYDQLGNAIESGPNIATASTSQSAQPPVSTPPATDKTEGEGTPTSIDPSSFGIRGSKLSASIMDDKGNPLPAPAKAAQFKTGTQWGTNPVIARASTSKVVATASAQKVAKDTKKNQSGGKLDTDHPTAASQDMSKNILDAAMAANPQALGHVLEKALQSMIMLKMMDKLTSPAGILSMASGGLGGALQGLAGNVGLSPMIGALNNVMPALSTSGLLTASATNALHTGMMGMMNNVAVGALAVSEVAAAASTVSTISGAMSAISSGEIGNAIDAVASFGGPTFGLQPGSLAAKIALVGPSGNITTSSNIGGVQIVVNVKTSSIPQLTQNIPILNGAEHVAIAAAAVSNITGNLSDVLGVQNGAGNVAGAISDITGGISNLAGAFSNISSFTHGSLAGVVNGGIAGIVDGGLNKILGFPISGLLGNVTKLLPQIGGSITSSLSNLGAAGANIGNLTAGLQNATKALSLSKAAHNVAQNIFGQARAEQIVDAIGSVSSLAAQVGGPITHVTAFGDTITAAPANTIKTTLDAGTQIVRGTGLMLA